MPPLLEPDYWFLTPDVCHTETIIARPRASLFIPLCGGRFSG